MALSGRARAIAAAQLAQLEELEALRAAKQTRDRERYRAEYLRHKDDPAAWVAESVTFPRGGAATEYQLEAMTELAVNHRLALRGCRGVGKTGTASLVINHFAHTREALEIDWKILATAGVMRHLVRALWPEIHKWSPRIGGLYRPFIRDKELLTLSLQLPHGQAFGAVARNPDLIESAHADEMLIVVDEGKSVPDAVWDALEGSLTGETGQYALALSTPGQPAGRFYEICQGRHPEWSTMHVTPERAVAAGRVSQRWIDARRRSWGERSAMYLQQVLGEFAADDENAVVPLSFVEGGMERWEAWRQAGRPATLADVGPKVDAEARAEWEARGCPVAAGDRSYAVDVATTGKDKTVIATRTGRHITKLDYTTGNTTMVVVAKVQGVVGKAGLDERHPIVVDATGVGSGVADRLAELGYNVIRYTGAAATKATSKDGKHGFTNVRSAAYWRLRELLDTEVPADEAIMIPPFSELTADLTTPTWTEVTGIPPKYKVETKVDLVKRLGRSPDMGDAVAMAYWLDAAITEARMAPPSSRRLNRRGLTSVPQLPSQDRPTRGDPHGNAHRRGTGPPVQLPPAQDARPDRRPRARPRRRPRVRCRVQRPTPGRARGGHGVHGPG